MTIQEFSNTRFCAGMKVEYQGEIRNLVSVDFEESLIGIEFGERECEECGHISSDIYWVRCENCNIIKDKSTDENRIPPITDPLDRHWQQPDASEILLDDRYAVMTRASFDKLQEYSSTNPSALYNGKMWKSVVSGKDGPVYLLRFCYNENIEDNLIDITSREILILI